jgi:hypothetical protein
MGTLSRTMTYLGWAAWFWSPPVIVLALATFRAGLHRRLDVQNRPPVAELWLTLLLPGLALVWGAVAYAYAAPDGQPTPARTHWAFHVLDALTLAGVVVAVALGRRHRATPALATFTAVAVVLFALIAWFISSMSIGNDWL